MKLTWPGRTRSLPVDAGEHDLSPNLDEQLAHLDPCFDPIVAGILHRRWLEMFRLEGDISGCDHAEGKPPRCFV